TTASVSLFNRQISVNAGGGTFDTNGHDSTFTDMVGTGTFTKTGAGQLLMTSDSVFNGTVAVSQGTFKIFTGKTLQLGSGGTTGGLSGNIDNDGLVNFNRSNASSYEGVMSGAGSLEKN